MNADNDRQRYIEGIGMVPTGPRTPPSGTEGRQSSGRFQQWSINQRSSQSSPDYLNHDSGSVSSDQVSIKEEPDLDVMRHWNIASPSAFSAALARNRGYSLNSSQSGRQRRSKSNQERRRNRSPAISDETDYRYFGNRRDRHRGHSSHRDPQNPPESPIFFSDNDPRARDDGSPERELSPSPQDTDIAQRPELCLCPVSTYCANRENNLLDCRTLVAKWVPWNNRADEDIYTM